MNTFRKAYLLLALTALCTGLLTGCGSQSDGANGNSSAPVTNGAAQNADGEAAPPTESAPVTELYVRFGDSEAFPMHLYDNATAAAIAGYVGTADWRLPIYHYDDYEGWEVMQYYDIPSRYEIPSDSETVSVEQAGTVYYSEPNRIVLFYGDANISGAYTPVGYFDATDDFVSAVEDNPVVEGWSNKLVHISAED
ncbi:MAG: cyclophilin-like fold protein [Eubacteriales bacterium]|nr:cyclophilin-like fold protein [Eubacteriales bacterium]